jgi:vitamin B12 transporter
MKTCQFILRPTPARLLAYTTAIAVLNCNTVLAQTAGPELTQLATVVVTAASTPQTITDALPHTTSIRQADIVRSQATDLTTLLAREVGFQLTQNGGRGQVSGMFLRGAPASQVLVLIDGVPITKQDASGTLSMEHLMLDQVDHIEIVRGNVSAIYGSGAVGGVIQIFTKSGGKSGASINTEIGSRGSAKLSANAQLAFGEFGQGKLAAGYGYNRTDGFSAMNTEQNTLANPDKDGYRNQNWSLAGSLAIVKDHRVGFKTTHSDGKFDFDSAFDSPNSIHTGRAQLDASSVFVENRLTSNWLSKLTYAQSAEKNSNRYPENDYGPAYSDAYTSKNASWLWHNTLVLGEHSTMTAGLELQKQSVDVDDGYGDVYAKQRTVNAYFIGLQTRLDAHSIQANLRKDSIAGLESPTTYYLGYGFALRPQWKLTASISSAFNLAPLGYLYASFGNPLLKPEFAQSSELGLQYSEGKDIMRATVFSTKTKDQIVYVGRSFENVAKTKNTGLELSYSRQLGSGGDVRVSLTHQNPINESTQQILNRRAKTMATVSLSQPMGAWRMGVDVRYSGATTDTVSGESHRLMAFALADLSVRYSLSSQLSAYARLENVTNSSHQTVYGYNSSPRSLFVGVLWQPMY